MVQKDAIEQAKVVLNGKPASIHSVVRNGDVISHTLHRHEPPVTAQPIGIVHEDNDMIVINKPAGVPVHPAGRYNYNSIVEIMRAERGHQWNPLPCNRLDRLTSGIMFIGKHGKAAERIAVQIKEHTVKKEYVARVIGEFPEGDIACDQPIMQVSPKLGLNRARASGKSAKTVFRRLAYYPPPIASDPTIPPAQQTPPTPGNDNGQPWKAKAGYSIVRCLPLTGRTHQLRVHLQYLSHPIANDPIYSNQRVFGPTLGAFDSSSSSDETIIATLSRMGKEDVADATAYHDEMMAEYNKQKAEKMTGELCGDCGTPLYSDPGIHELGIYLHAMRYADSGGKWSYETELPVWAMPPVGAVGPVEITSETEPVVVGDEFEAGEGLAERNGEMGKISEKVGDLDEQRDCIEPSKPP